MRRTFNPRVSNLNVHLDADAFAEFKRDWPESMPFGLHPSQESRHSPPWVAMKDVVADESERWRLIANCDINRHWSAMLGVFRGELRAWFCEIAGAQSMLHQDEPDYPDTGIKIEVHDDEVVCGFNFVQREMAGGEVVPKKWWRLPMTQFADQVRRHCHDCGVPLRGYGELACSTDPAAREQVSETHVAIFRPKRVGRRVETVTTLTQLGVGRIERVTDYVGNARR